jgi:NitT/TauT family transport system ATP-binding protein
VDVRGDARGLRGDACDHAAAEQSCRPSCRPTPPLDALQRRGIDDEPIGIDNVIAGLEFRGVPRAEAVVQGEAWLRRVGLAGFGDRYPHQMSGGMRKRLALAQTLILSPDILLMDEPFSALDVQTRQLMENEVLDLWAAKKKAVLFITHDLDEAIAMSDRVVVLSAGPATHPIGEFTIDLARPRDVAEVRTHPRFVELHTQIWGVLRDEVLKGYAQQLKKVA